jgi:hypothetical protein
MHIAPIDDEGPIAVQDDYPLARGGARHDPVNTATRLTVSEVL